MNDSTPQQIRQRNIEARRYELELNLRRRIKTELEFMRLPFDDREQWRSRFLRHVEYNPDIPMRKNNWTARLAYHRSHVALIRDLDFMNFYLNGN